MYPEFKLSIKYKLWCHKNLNFLWAELVKHHTAVFTPVSSDNFCVALTPSSHKVMGNPQAGSRTTSGTVT